MRIALKTVMSVVLLLMSGCDYEREKDRVEVMALCDRESRHLSNTNFAFDRKKHREFSIESHYSFLDKRCYGKSFVANKNDNFVTTTLYDGITKSVLLQCTHDHFGDGKDGDGYARVYFDIPKRITTEWGLDATSIKNCYEAETVINELMATR